MEQMKNLGAFALWFSSRMLFTIIVDLTLFGGYHAYNWYQTTQPQEWDLSALNADERSELSKQLFIIGQEESEAKSSRRK